MTKTEPEKAMDVANDTASVSLFTDEVKELVAIGAAVAGNCEKCFTYHYEKAKKLGVSHEDMLQAATLGKTIKEKPSKALSDLVRDRLIAHAALSISGLADNSLLSRDTPTANRETKNQGE